MSIWNVQRRVSLQWTSIHSVRQPTAFYKLSRGCFRREDWT